MVDRDVLLSKCDAIRRSMKRIKDVTGLDLRSQADLAGPAGTGIYLGSLSAHLSDWNAENK